MKRVVINIRASKNISGLVKVSVTSPAGLMKYFLNVEPCPVHTTSVPDAHCPGEEVFPPPPFHPKKTLKKLCSDMHFRALLVKILRGNLKMIKSLQIHPVDN